MQMICLTIAFSFVNWAFQGKLEHQIRNMSLALECAPCPLCGVLPNTTSGPLDHFRFPAYLRQPGFLTPDECNWLIESVEKRHNYYPGYVGIADGKVGLRANRRLANHADVGKHSKDFGWVLQRAFDYVRRKNRELWRYPLPSSVDSALIENMMFITYNGSVGGHYDWHMDSGVHEAIARRKLSVVLMLSPADGYQGGDLMLRPEGTELRMPREQGSLYVFPSFVYHKVEPVRAGMRHSLVMQMGSW